MNTFSHVPPGFRFHPTDEELVDYYLRKKVASRKIELDVIKDVDLYKIEPWDLQEKCRIGVEEQNDWYFFSHKDKKYPTGTRTNRATTAGFWKATGRDKPIYAKNNLVGMRKTLVFYKGRAPNGHKSDWIMHEYRLETDEIATPQEEGWVVCRVFKKRVPATTRPIGHDSPCWFGEQVSFMPEFDYPIRNIASPPNIACRRHHHHHLYSCKPELHDLHYNIVPHDPFFLQLPQLESPNLPQTYINNQGNAPQSSSFPLDHHDRHQESIQASGHGQLRSISAYNSTDQAVEQVTDWRLLDQFVASQLSQDDASKEPNYQVPDKQEGMCEYASTSNSSGCEIDLWK